jgi:hypothetical protein
MLDQRHCAAVGLPRRQPSLNEQQARDHAVHDLERRRNQLRSRSQQQAQQDRRRQLIRKSACHAQRLYEPPESGAAPVAAQRIISLSGSRVDQGPFHDEVKEWSPCE